MVQLAFFSIVVSKDNQICVSIWDAQPFPA